MADKDEDDIPTPPDFADVVRNAMQKAVREPGIVGEQASRIAPGLLLTPEQLAKIMFNTMLEKAEFHTGAVDERYYLVVTPGDMAHLKAINPDTAVKAIDILHRAVQTALNHDKHDLDEDRQEVNKDHDEDAFSYFALGFSPDFDDTSEIITILKDDRDAIEKGLSIEALIQERHISTTGIGTTH